MALINILKTRAQGKCELCSCMDPLSLYEIPPLKSLDENSTILICTTCKEQIDDPRLIDPHHWHCLKESMWSEFPPVQIMAYRLLTALKNEAWARELLEGLYLDEALLLLAQSGIPEEVETSTETPTRDSNGTILAEGDSVTLVKDLEVKGAGFTAKRGTLVKNISLTNNPKHIEGRVNGIQIVLVAEYLKKVQS